MSAHNEHNTSIKSITKLEWGAIQIAAAMRSNTDLLNDLIKLAEKEEMGSSQEDVRNWIAEEAVKQAECVFDKCRETQLDLLQLFNQNRVITRFSRNAHSDLGVIDKKFDWFTIHGNSPKTQVFNALGYLRTKGLAFFSECGYLGTDLPESFE